MNNIPQSAIAVANVSTSPFSFAIFAYLLAVLFLGSHDCAASVHIISGCQSVGPPADLQCGFYDRGQVSWLLKSVFRPRAVLLTPRARNAPPEPHPALPVARMFFASPARPFESF